MTLTFQLGNQDFKIQAEGAEEITEGLILHGVQVHVYLPALPQSYYRHGWQSWSLATWQAPDQHIPVQKPSILHPMQIDPLYARHPAPNSSWLGAVAFEDGQVLLLGALGLDAHVSLHEQLHGWYEVPRMGYEMPRMGYEGSRTGREAGSGDWFLAYGDEETVFARYAELLGERLGKAQNKPAPRVWCSWYSLYRAIDEGLLKRVFEGLDDLPFDVFQVDDGWQVSIGDWEANKKFPSGMEALAANIRASGRTPGLWLAPLLVVPSSRTFREHSDWLLHDADGKLVSAGFNWGEPLYSLDTTHPEVLEWLAALMKKVRAWGFDYLKLDFLYAGALPGKRHTDVPRESAYRQGMCVIREALGTDAYLLTCGAPILPSLGLCDALRVGPDVAEAWENQRDASLLYNPTIPGVRNAIRTTINRLWLSPLVATDPDVAYFRSQHSSLSQEHKRMLSDLALVCNFKATSDLPQWLNTDEREALRTFLEAEPHIEQVSRYIFHLDGREVDFSPAIPLPTPPRGLNSLGSALMGWLGNQRWVLTLMNRLNDIALKKMQAR
ncbi:MAG: alpha-galactosidase [Anaerolineales bacterium]|jgi:alpha-galactosidase